MRFVDIFEKNLKKLQKTIDKPRNACYNGIKLRVATNAERRNEVMKAKDFKKIFGEIFEQTDKITDNAFDTYQFVSKIADYESTRGSDAQDVIAELLDNDLRLDGKDQREFYVTLTGNPYPTEFDVEGAKAIWILEECIRFNDMLCNADLRFNFNRGVIERDD